MNGGTAWAGDKLKVPSGRLMGKPFEFQDWQVEFLGGPLASGVMEESPPARGRGLKLALHFADAETLPFSMPIDNDLGNGRFPGYTASGPGQHGDGEADEFNGQGSGSGAGVEASPRVIGEVSRMPALEGCRRRRHGGGDGVGVEVPGPGRPDAPILGSQ